MRWPGHDVVGLTRDESGDEVVRNRGGEPIRGDILDRRSLHDVVAGTDVVVHAATKIPTDTNPSESDWELNDRVRREGTENLVAASADHGVDRIIVQSIVWVARQPTLHFLVENPDHVAELPASPWRSLFRASAVGVFVTPAIGVVVGAWYWPRMD